MKTNPEIAQGNERILETVGEPKLPANFDSSGLSHPVHSDDVPISRNLRNIGLDTNSPAKSAPVPRDVENVNGGQSDVQPQFENIGTPVGAYNSHIAKDLVNVRVHNNPPAIGPSGRKSSRRYSCTIAPHYGRYGYCRKRSRLATLDKNNDGIAEEVDSLPMQESLNIPRNSGLGVYDNRNILPYDAYRLNRGKDSRRRINMGDGRYHRYDLGQLEEERSLPRSYLPTVRSGEQPQRRRRPNQYWA